MARVWGVVVVSVAGVAGCSSPTPLLARIRLKALARSHGGPLAPHMAKVVTSAVRHLKDADSVFPRTGPAGHRYLWHTLGLRQVVREQRRRAGGLMRPLFESLSEQNSNRMDSVQQRLCLLFGVGHKIAMGLQCNRRRTCRGRRIRQRRCPGHHGAETTTVGGHRLEEEQEGRTSFFQGDQGLLATHYSSWQRLPYFPCKFRTSLCVCNGPAYVFLN